MEQEIRFLDSELGPFACAWVGSGTPLVMPCWWIGGVDLQWHLSGFRAFVAELARGPTAVPSDPPRRRPPPPPPPGRPLRPARAPPPARRLRSRGRGPPPQARRRGARPAAGDLRRVVGGLRGDRVRGRAAGAPLPPRGLRHLLP